MKKYYFERKMDIFQLKKNRFFPKQGINGIPGDWCGRFRCNVVDDDGNKTSKSTTVWLGKNRKIAEREHTKQLGAFITEAQESMAAGYAGKVLYEQFVDLFISQKITSQTQRNYSQHRRNFEAYWESNNTSPKYISDITYAHLSGYVSHRIQLGYAPKSNRVAIAYIKSLLTEAYNCGYIANKFWDKIKFPSDVKILKSYSITAEQLETICKYVRYDSGNIYRLYFYSGCRNNELCEMKWDWVDWDKRIINIPREVTKRGLNKPPKAVNIGMSAYNILIEQKALVLQRTKNREYVFVGHHQQKLTTSTVLSRFKRAIKRAIADGEDIPPGLTIHMLRHSCATEIRRRGGTDHEVQQQLDHLTPAVSRGYGEQVASQKLLDILEGF